MRGASTARGAFGALALLLGGALLAPASHAVEAFDGRVEVHGYYEAQIRSIVRDFEFSDDWDLTQWWNILNIEVEANVAPDGFGPFDVISVFGRIEVRYDCVWTGACTFFDSADAYGFTHEGKLPKRLNDARRTGYQGTHYMDDRRAFTDVPYRQLSYAADDRRFRPDGSREPMHAWQTPLFASLFGGSSYGLDGIPMRGPAGAANRTALPPFDLGTDNEVFTSQDDPPWLFFADLTRSDCDRWGARKRTGTQNGSGNGDTLQLNPNCKFDEIGAAADVPNPFNANDFNPLIGTFGSAALPYRPAPELRADSRAEDSAGARGNFYPNYRLQRLLDDDQLSSLDTNFRRGEIAWNRGQSQQEQKELKELYVDFEMFDSRLFVRAGYQTIVWGKTELFRNQDQWNPQDIGLSSLPSLEESRISLWAIRGIWSFYDIGPLNDVRLELAVNIDEYQPTDPGVCGEPYAPLAVCALPVGLISHGYLGVGLAGAVFPGKPWDDSHGLEYGARLEFRWDRFSFAVTDFYGFQDFPYVEQLFNYSRNVDPISGRPRHTMTTNKCRTGKESGCLDDDKALTEHSVNQQLFSAICFNTLAVAPTLDPTACLANIFGSPNRTAPNPVLGFGPRVVVALNIIAAGDTTGGLAGDGAVLSGIAEFPADGRVQDAIQSFHHAGARKATVNLVRDASTDGDFPDVANASDGNTLIDDADFNDTVLFFYNVVGGKSLSGVLTEAQEALLGCGPFYGTSCDLDGIDFLNMEASVLTQSWPHVEGTFRGKDFVWDTTDRHTPQPGTRGFEGGPACSRFENGKTFILPGCRGPGDDGYNPGEDGTVAGVLHPWTGQQFKNELGAWSWNVLMGLVGFSTPTRPFGELTGPRPAPQQDEFDSNDPFRHGGCSFREPQWCASVGAILGLTGQQRPSIRAGGNGRFGRRDFVYHSGGVGLLRVDKSNIFGFSMDFAEDVTKSNWGVEFTWVKDLHVGNNDEMDGLTDGIDLYRLTISVDRPTFVNFLNANRTFFINTQWFFQYTDDFQESFTGPSYQWDIFGVLAISTGYFQDRLLPSLTMVYFVRNNSLAFLPQITYRFTENFQATFGLAAFAGREQEIDMPINGLAPVSERFGRNAYKSFIEPGLAVVRERDELFLRIRYTF
jgi:hypothetical protein